MKLGRKLTKLAIFTILFVLTSMALAVTVAAMTSPRQPTHRINIAPRTAIVSYPAEVVIDVHITRLPYADDFGNHGTGWFDFNFDILFDQTRFEAVPYSTGTALARSDFDLWRDMHGNPVSAPLVSARRNPWDAVDPAGTIRIALMEFTHTPVMSDVTVSLRFRVLESALPGNNVVFGWAPNALNVAGSCPVGLFMSVHRLPLEGPTDLDFGRVTVLPPGTPTQPTHSIDIVPRTPTVSVPGEVELDIHVSRLPYADTVGHHGIGWFDFFFDIYFDSTRFVPIPYLGSRLAYSNFDDWLNVSGERVYQPGIFSVLDPIDGAKPGGTIRVLLSEFMLTPVMSDVVVNLRFRLLENAAPGDAVFSWGHSAGVAGACPVTGVGNVVRLLIAGPYGADFGTVTVTQ